MEASTDLITAISTAMTVISLQKLPKDDVPPKQIWGHSEKLMEWLEALERKQNMKAGEEAIDEPEDRDMARNELVDEALGRNKRK